MMKRAQRSTMLFLAIVCLLVIATDVTYAYIDAGTGSYLLQILAAAVFATLFVIRSFWKNIKAGLSRLVARTKQQQNNE